MLAAGLRELFILGEDYVYMIACQKRSYDVILPSALSETEATARQSVASYQLSGFWYFTLGEICCVRL